MRKLSHPFIAELKRYVANQNTTLGPIIMSLSELIKINPEFTKFNQDEIQSKQRKLSEVTDMIHAAHVFHRCVRDSICDSGTPTAKRLHQDNIMSLLVGDYLLAQSSVDMADLRYPRTVGLIAKGLEDYTRGEFLKLQLLGRKCDKEQQQQQQTSSDTDLRLDIERYSELTCGSLLSNACLSAALLAGYPDRASGSTGGQLSELVYQFGFHTGSAHRLIEFLYCPDTNSEDDKTFIQSLNVKDFQEPIKRHLDLSVELLYKLPDGRNCSSLLAMVDEMKSRCSLTSQVSE